MLVSRATNFGASLACATDFGASLLTPRWGAGICHGETLGGVGEVSDVSGVWGRGVVPMAGTCRVEAPQTCVL